MTQDPTTSRRDFIASAAASAGSLALATTTGAGNDHADPGHGHVRALVPVDFGAAAANYIDAFFKKIQWDVVASRLDKAKQRQEPRPLEQVEPWMTRQRSIWERRLDRLDSDLSP